MGDSPVSWSGKLDGSVTPCCEECLLGVVHGYWGAEGRDMGICRRPESILGGGLFDLDKLCQECGMNSSLCCCKQMHKNLKTQVKAAT